MTATNSHDAGNDQTPVLNQELLDQYRSRKSNLLERLIKAWLEEAPRFFDGIRQASAEKNLKDVRAHAHALKSCSNNLGAVRLAKTCQNLESAALSEDNSVVDEVMTQIGPEFFEAEQALRGELFNLNPDANSFIKENIEEQNFSSDWI